MAENPNAASVWLGFLLLGISAKTIFDGWNALDLVGATLTYPILGTLTPKGALGTGILMLIVSLILIIAGGQESDN